MKTSYDKFLIKSYKTKIYSKFLKAIKEYNLIEENDKIAVCISGGKDSFLLALCFKELSNFSEVPFEVKYILMNPGYKEEHLNLIKENIKKLEINCEIFDTNIFKISNMQEKNKCYICAKMRRGALYQKAKDLGCNKIALGHHFNDQIETTLMNIFYSGEFSIMLPILNSTNFDGMKLIRPLYYVREKDIINFWDEQNIEFIKCACYLTSDEVVCESSKRQVVKKLIKELDDERECNLKANRNERVAEIDKQKEAVNTIYYIIIFIFRCVFSNNGMFFFNFF